MKNKNSKSGKIERRSPLRGDNVKTNLHKLTSLSIVITVIVMSIMLFPVKVQGDNEEFKATASEGLTTTSTISSTTTKKEPISEVTENDDDSKMKESNSISVTTKTTAEITSEKKSTTKQHISTTKAEKTTEKETKVYTQSTGKWTRYQATAYCGCKKCNGQYVGQPTASGRQAKSNYTIAVDPSVIPLGKKVEIQGYGIYSADDTGSKIKGHIIDVYFDSHSEALDFGRRTVYLRICE